MNVYVNSKLTIFIKFSVKSYVIGYHFLPKGMIQTWAPWQWSNSNTWNIGHLAIL